MRPFWKSTVLCLAASLYAQEAISLSGQVVDRQGRALPSIEVLLVGQNQADTTDTEGHYAIERSAALPEDPQASTVRPTGLFPAPQSAHRLFNAHGRAQNAQRPYALPHQAYYAQSTATAPQNTESALRLASAGQDQLQFSQNGNLLAVQPVMALSAVMGVTTVNPVTTFVDERDGREYRYIESAGQYWMAQNLNYGYKVAASNTMASDNFTEKYCIGDDTLNCNLWGGLYKWAEAMALPSSCNKYDCAGKITPTGHQGICPDGWTIPTPADWGALVASGNGDAATMAPLLKNDTGWAQSLNGTNDLSFNALPTGSRNSKAQFVNQGTHAYWWSATQYDVENATVQYIWGSKDGLYESTSLKGDNGFGVRCRRGPQPIGWPAYCYLNIGNCGTFIDARDGQEYRWTKIGKTKWMAQNLNFGIMISPSLDQTDETKIEKYCDQNLQENCTTYGALYQWHEAMNLSNSCLTNDCTNQISVNHFGICPLGWRIPTLTDWEGIINHSTTNVQLGIQLKTISGWKNNQNGNDAFGISIYPAADRNLTSSFGPNNFYNSLWVSNGSNKISAKYVHIRYDSNNLNQNILSKNYGFSIRCVQ